MSSQRPGGPRPSRQPSRGLLVLLVLAVGGAALAGLLLRGPVSVLLLLLVAGVLAWLSSRTWGWVSPAGRAVRLAVLAGVLALAVSRLGRS